MTDRGAGGSTGDGLGPIPAVGTSPIDPDDAPQPVRRAVVLMYVRAVVSAVSLVITLTGLNALKDTLRKDHPSFTQAEVNSAVNTAIAVTAVTAILFLVLYVFLAAKLKRGNRWARSVTFVLTGFGIAFAVLTLGGAATGFTKVFSIATVAIDVAIAVSLVKGGDWFSRRGAV